MKATELFHANGKTAGVWYCSECRIVRKTQQEAEECCKPKICTRCKTAECQEYRTVCKLCNDIIDREREEERFAKAEKVTEWNGPVYSDSHDIGNEGYAENIEEALDWLECMSEDGKIPEYVWTCNERPICHLNFDSIIESSTSEAYEGWETENLNGLEELEAAIEKFNELNKDDVCWLPNYKKALLIKK